MDRNVVIATVLIALIMLVWLMWLAPQPAVEPIVPDDSLTVDTSAVSRPDLVEEAEPEVPSEVTDSLIAGARQGEEAFITVESELYQARLSTKGATLVSFVLKEYTQFDQQTPVQLVNRSEEGALGIVFTTPANHVVDTRALFFTPDYEDETLVVEDAPRELTFEARLGEGIIRQIYTFHPDNYEVELRVEEVGSEVLATGGGYELVWYGGIPFTEGNPEDEARHAGAYARSGGEVEYIDLNKAEADAQQLSGNVSWVAVKNKYFTSVIMPQQDTRGAEIEGERVGSLEEGNLWKDYSVRLSMQPPAEEPDHFRMYLGPIEYYRITDYGVGLYDMVDYGWDFFEVITRPLAKFIFIPLFTFLGNILKNYGLAIIVFSILMKIVLYPLTKSSYKNMARMRELQPKMEAIKEKYPDNPQKQQEAMMKMYKETGVNPLGGCLPMLLQWPVLIALYQFIPQSLELRQASFLWAEDLSAPDVILNLPFTIPFYGDFVAGFTLLMGLSMIVQMRIQSQPSTNAQAKVMMYVMPVMLFMIFNRFASGLSLYYLVYNIVTAIQQQFINKSTEKHAAETGKGAAEGSKFSRRLREAADGRSKKPGKVSKKERT